MFKKQEIFHGSVLDDGGKHPKLPLAADGGILSQYRDASIPANSSRAIYVERDSPYKAVQFTFVLSPDIPVGSIFVAPVPEKVRWKRNPNPIDPNTGTLLTYSWSFATSARPPEQGSYAFHVLWKARHNIRS